MDPPAMRDAPSGDRDRVRRDEAVPALHIASTPLIALSCAAAARAAGGRARLVLIEDFDQAMRLRALLLAWRDNPFEQILCFPGRYRRPGSDQGRSGLAGWLQRAHAQRTSRRGTLATLRQVDAELQPRQVWLGNDRRIETQLPLELASRRAGAMAGRYLDDGLYTYLGDVREGRARWRLDDEIKRLVYGRWWTRVGHAGTSRWIEQAWLAYPDLARHLYAGQRLCALPRGWYANRAFARLCIDAARDFALDRKSLRACDAVWVLPHSGQLRKEPALTRDMRAAMVRLAADGKRIALKHHPRESEPDPAGLMEAGAASVLPKLLPMELMLPLMPRGAFVVGEITTALMAAHWLRPDLAVRDLGLAKGGYATRARALFERVGIASLHGDLARAFEREPSHG